MKNLIALTLLFLFSLPAAIAQKDFKFMTKPELRLDMELPPHTSFRFTNEEPNLYKFKVIVDGKEVHILKSNVTVTAGNATLEKVQGVEGQWIVTPHCAPDSMWVQLRFAFSSPGYRVLMPVPKEGVTSLWDADRKLILANVKSWKSYTGQDGNSEFVIEHSKFSVMRQGIHLNGK